MSARRECTEESEAIPVGAKTSSLQRLDIELDLDWDVAHHRKVVLEMESSTKEPTSKSTSRFRSKSTRARKVKLALIGLLPCAGLCFTLLGLAT